MEPYKPHVYHHTIDVNAHSSQGNQVVENSFLSPSQAAVHPLSQTSETAVKIIKSVGEGTRAAVNLKNLSQNQDKEMEQVIAKRNFQFIDMIEEQPIREKCEDVTVLLRETMLLLNFVLEKKELYEAEIVSLVSEQIRLVKILKNKKSDDNSRLIDRIKNNNSDLNKYMYNLLHE